MDEESSAKLRDALTNDRPELLLELAAHTREVNGAPLLA
jgi:hypothetical protein